MSKVNGRITSKYQELLKLFDRETDQEAISLLLNWFKQLVVQGRRKVSDYELYIRKGKEHCH